MADTLANLAMETKIRSQVCTQLCVRGTLISLHTLTATYTHV
jgi:hypothetical protein